MLLEIYETYDVNEKPILVVPVYVWYNNYTRFGSIQFTNAGVIIDTKNTARVIIHTGYPTLEIDIRNKTMTSSYKGAPDVEPCEKPMEEIYNRIRAVLICEAANGAS